MPRQKKKQQQNTLSQNVRVFYPLSKAKHEYLQSQKKSTKISSHWMIRIILTKL